MSKRVVRCREGCNWKIARCCVGHPSTGHIRTEVCKFKSRPVRPGASDGSSCGPHVMLTGGERVSEDKKHWPVTLAVNRQGHGRVAVLADLRWVGVAHRARVATRPGCGSRGCDYGRDGGKCTAPRSAAVEARPGGAECGLAESQERHRPSHGLPAAAVDCVQR